MRYGLDCVLLSLLSDLELTPVGILEVKLVQAKELTNKDIIGKSDPYAVLYIRPLRDRMKTSKTIVSAIAFRWFSVWILFLHGVKMALYFIFQNNQLNPVWNEHFEFVVEDPSTQHLVVKIYDDEGVQASELIGCVQVPLKDLEAGKVKDVWLKLVKDLEIQRDNKYRGQVRILITRQCKDHFAAFLSSYVINSILYLMKCKIENQTSFIQFQKVIFSQVIQKKKDHMAFT